jgi:hypothetical protein
MMPLRYCQLFFAAAAAATLSLAIICHYRCRCHCCFSLLLLILLIIFAVAAIFAFDAIIIVTPLSPLRRPFIIDIFIDYFAIISPCFDISPFD